MLVADFDWNHFCEVALPILIPILLVQLAQFILTLRNGWSQATAKKQDANIEVSMVAAEKANEAATGISSHAEKLDENTQITKDVAQTVTRLEQRGS